MGTPKCYLSYYKVKCSFFPFWFWLKISAVIRALFAVCNWSKKHQAEICFFLTNHKLVTVLRVLGKSCTLFLGNFDLKDVSGKVKTKLSLFYYFLRVSLEKLKLKSIKMGWRIMTHKNLVFRRFWKCGSIA